MQKLHLFMLLVNIHSVLDRNLKWIVAKKG